MFLQGQDTVPELPEPTDEKMQVGGKRSPEAAEQLPGGSCPGEELIHSPGMGMCCINNRSIRPFS